MEIEKNMEYVETWQGDIAIDDIEIRYCPVQLNVNNPIIPDGIYRASDLIVSDRQVPTNGEVIFRSGNQIDLNGNFETLIGGQFEATILDCFD